MCDRYFFLNLAPWNLWITWSSLSVSIILIKSQQEIVDPEIERPRDYTDDWYYKFLCRFIFFLIWTGIFLFFFFFRILKVITCTPHSLRLHKCIKIRNLSSYEQRSRFLPLIGFSFQRNQNIGVESRERNNRRSTVARDFHLNESVIRARCIFVENAFVRTWPRQAETNETEFTTRWKLAKIGRFYRKDRAWQE